MFWLGVLVGLAAAPCLLFVIYLAMVAFTAITDIGEM